MFQVALAMALVNCEYLFNSNSCEQSNPSVIIGENL